MPIGFKLVAIEDGRYYSYTSNGKVEYIIGKQTKPIKGNGPLCVFDNGDNALKFLESDTLGCSMDIVCNDGIYTYDNGFGGLFAVSIFKCMYKRSRLDELWYIHECNENIKTELRFLPQGTVLASNVTIMEIAYIE